MKNLVLLIFTFFIFNAASAQYNLRELGDRAFKKAEYYQAAFYYRQAEDKKNVHGSIPFYSAGKGDKNYIPYRLAESYRLYRDFQNALDQYNLVLTTDRNVYPLARLWYGLCLRAAGRFDEALKELRQFKTTYKENKEFIGIAEREIANCLFAKKQLASYKPLKVIKMQAPWNDGAGTYALDGNAGNYWFTSSRLAADNKKHLNNIFTASEKNSSTPVFINFNNGTINTGNEYGTPSITPSGKKMYLTVWYKKEDKTILAIYSSELQNNTWSTPVKLNNTINAEGFNTLQPRVADDGKRLFFVSDRPGGQGGYDIWVSDLDTAGNPLNAVNLGKTINTQFDEEAPFYDTTHKKLYFSSTGFTGLGGFDVFESYENNGSWSVPQNLGYPVNSPKDDLYYYEDRGDNQIYISSDRESDCCLNLFKLKYTPVFISGKIIDCDSNKMLSGVNISLTDSISGAVLQKFVTGANGRYDFKNLKSTAFKLTTGKVGYFNKNISMALNGDTLYIPDICLKAFAVNKPIALKNILYDFNSAHLRRASKIELDNLVSIMLNNPHINIELASHTDSIGNDRYNLILSQKRAQSCVDYVISKGIDKSRIIAKGYGKNRPVAPNSVPNGKDNPAGRQLNRRTEFTVKSNF
ncbi:MAG: OmpA family protein [Mucilaginibacter sp.]|jgi:OOP family OmpA-OmpF porin|nr:OmpA family protein [Mucilaginibacter sp.]